jgi:uncharacterized protein (DUF1015 family)
MELRRRIVLRRKKLGEPVVDARSVGLKLRFNRHLPSLPVGLVDSWVMAVIRPFRGLRYAAAAGSLDTLVAPPYDVLSPEERDRYAAKNPHNVVHLTLPEARPDDRSKFVKYARSAALLAEWQREGALAIEDRPVLYRYTQRFTIPGTDQEHTRMAIIALIKIEPYENGVVLPHEQTFPKHKEDRLRILEATRSHLECIYGLFEDPDGQVFHKVEGAYAAPHQVSVSSEEGVDHLLELIEDPAMVTEICSLLADKKVWIADGHHRYETALAFRQMQGDRPGEMAEDYMMMALSSMSDPGLVLLPTHRIIKSGAISSTVIREKLEAAFKWDSVRNEDLLQRIDALGQEGIHAFGVVLPGGEGIVIRYGSVDEILSQIETEDSDRLKSLDVTVLHKYIFEKLLHLTGLEFFSYTRDPVEALQAVELGAPAAFLMNPPTVQDMREIALGGEKMPQKSTYYYPKILSGLVLWSLNDF